jgi:G3E family GTPase
MLANLPAAIYRAKGLLHFENDPGRRYVLHVVGQRLSILADKPWGEQKPLSQLVFIGERGGFDPAELEADLRACIA